MILLAVLTSFWRQNKKFLKKVDGPTSDGKNSRSKASTSDGKDSRSKASKAIPKARGSPKGEKVEKEQPAKRRKTKK